MNTSKLIIRDLAIEMSIGVNEQEKQQKQTVLISSDIQLATSPRSELDDITEVLSYDDIILGIKALCSGGHVHLVEKLAEDIASFILNQKEVCCCMVRVEKPDIYADAKAVGVEITRYAS